MWNIYNSSINTTNVDRQLGHCQRGWRLLVKRAFDCGIAFFGILLLGPLLAVLCALVWFSMGRPALFRQERPGRNARPFMLLKFRTMSDRRDANGILLPDAERMTRLGSFLRSTSLDEIPQLINVLRGDISLVGPRPLLTEYLDRYSFEQARRHEVLPGITGWAQVHGRNSLSWKEKFVLDTWYVDHWSIRIDLTILVKTIGRVLKREGISSTGHVTMPEFSPEKRIGTGQRMQGVK
jgi:sugar transferase EpsL